VSKRSLRPDPNFDALINKIYPNRDDYNAHQEHVLAARLRHSANPGAVLAQRLASQTTHKVLTVEFFVSLMLDLQLEFTVNIIRTLMYCCIIKCYKIKIR